MPDGLPESWPEYLYGFRARHGLTQADLAALLGVGLRTVNGWEAGEAIRWPLMLLRALRDLDCSGSSAETP